jgi:hypothetical protein
MALPVIVTNWSGPTAYLDESVGYPLRVQGLVNITQEGAFQGPLPRAGFAAQAQRWLAESARAACRVAVLIYTLLLMTPAPSAALTSLLQATAGRSPLWGTCPS